MPINIGALLGGNQGRGGLTPSLQDIAQRIKQKQDQARLYQVLQQASGQSLPPAGPMPTTQSTVPGSPMPGGPPGPIPAGAGRTPPALPSSSSSSQGFAAGMPNMEKVIAAVSQMDIPDDQKMAMLEQYGAFASPYEKMQQQLEIKQQQMQFQSDMLNERLREMDRLGMARVGTTERGQDIVSSDRKAALDEKKTEAAEKKNSPLRLSNDSEYQALKNDVSLWKAKVIDPTVRGKDHDEAMRQYQVANTKLAQYTKAHSGTAPFPAPVELKEPAADQPSQADLEFTAKKYGMTVDEVKAKLGIK